MQYKNILITGGCGFTGSSLALAFRKLDSNIEITCLDNLKRRGSEINIQKLSNADIQFIHGDIRNKEDLDVINGIDLILECSAEPSVLAGFNFPPEYILNTNLIGTINCLELARRTQSAMVFLSTSRVYPFKAVRQLKLKETETRFELSEQQYQVGASAKGINENFDLTGARSLYGTTKLASELVITEYIDMYDMDIIINRCGLLTGPGQFGKIDQGVIAFWVAQHYWNRSLSYIGYNGSGKQVRDMLHVDDLFQLLQIQLEDPRKHSGEVYNVGGGKKISVSLMELTELCEQCTGNKIKIHKDLETRLADIPLYISDMTKINAATGWKPTIKPDQMVEQIYNWLRSNEKILAEIII
jgi:CDP-paratose 2-epimerase